MYYKFTYLSIWLPRSTPENVWFEWYKMFLWIVFSWLWELKIRQKTSDIRLTKLFYKTSDFISVSFLLYSANVQYQLEILPDYVISRKRGKSCNNKMFC